MMKTPAAVTCLFLDIGGVLLTNGGDRLYLENTPMFVQIAEGLGIRSILHADYTSTRARLAAFGLQTVDESHP